MSKHWLYVTAAVALLAPPAVADVWDVQGANDDSIATTANQLVHGTIQTHDLAVRPGPVADQDWYLFDARPQASYEVIIDGASGDLFSFTANMSLQRRTTGNVLLQSDLPVIGGASTARALRWTNTTGGTPLQLIHVSGGACGTACGADDQYTIRARETTVNVPRFNAVGGQTTVLLTQNATERSILMTQFFWSPAGVLLQQNSLTIQPKALNVLNVASFPAVAGQSGSITVAHDGGYGGLVIKSVALEPATGFSFDTPGVYVPY